MKCFLTILSGGVAAVSLLTATQAANADYASEVLNDNPVAYWRLNESSGTTAADQSPNNIDGTYTGSVVQGVAGPRPADGFAGLGSGNLAAQFGANDAAVTAGLDVLNNLFGAPAVTVETFFRTTDQSIDTNNKMVWIGLHLNGAAIEFSRESSGFFVGSRSIRWDDFQSTRGGDGSAADGLWHHAVAVADYANNETRIYLDGTLIAQETSVGYSQSELTQTGLDDPKQAALGARGNGLDLEYDGDLDETAVYGYALDDPNGDGDLSDSRVGAHYDAATTIPEPASATVIGLAGTALIALRRH